MALQVTTSSLLVLDSGIIGLVTNPKLSADALECSHWLKALLVQQIPIAITEISDYEIRRELLRADKIRGLMSLDILRTNLLYIPITTNMMLKAAELWAETRKHGKPTAAPESLDADVILAAQTIVTATLQGYDPVIASTNVKHLAYFVQAARWQDIEVIR